MKQVKKTSLGIVLTEQYIEVVCVERTPSRQIRIRGGRLSLPTGVIRKGQITSPQKAAACIQKLLKQEKIVQRKAVVVVPDSQTVAQILELPADLPTNMHKYIHTEVRYSPILNKRTPYSDYRSLRTDGDEKERILIGVTTRECIDNLIHTLSLAGVEAVSLEMDFCSLYRTLYSQALTVQKTRHVLLAGITGQTLTLCVLIENKLDFIQRFSMPAQTDAQRSAVLRQLQTIRQFYEIEKGYSFHQDWRVRVVLDTGILDKQSWCSELDALFGDSCVLYTPSDLAAVIGRELKQPVSFTGYGAALKALEPAGGLPVPELLPRFFRDHYAWKRTTRMTAAVAAGIVLILYAGAFLFQTFCRAETTPAQIPAARAVKLVHAHQELQTRVNELRKLKDTAETLAGQDGAFSYAVLLREIGMRIPAGLQVTSLEIIASGTISLRGRALSFQAIHQFSASLDQSEWIGQTSVEESRQNSDSARIFDYLIHCRIRTAAQEEQTK